VCRQPEYAKKLREGKERGKKSDSSVCNRNQQQQHDNNKQTTATTTKQGGDDVSNCRFFFGLGVDDKLPHPHPPPPHPSC